MSEDNKPVSLVKRVFIFGLFAGFLITSCSHSQVPQFNKITAFNYLKKQCNFGPRNPGSEGHTKCLRFLVKEFKQTADTVIKQPFIFWLNLL